MNERERIIDLIKRGVISSAEGLTLLEDIAKQGGVNGRSGRTIVVDWHGDDATTKTTGATLDKSSGQTVLRADAVKNASRSAGDDDRAKDRANVGKRPIRYLVRRSVRDVIDNVDWHDVTRHLPGAQNRRGTKTFNLANSQATIVDVEIANGSVHYHSWTESGFKVVANVRVFGHIDGDAVQALMDRSVIKIDDNEFTVKVPDKRVTVDLDVRLPQRRFDHFNTQVLNGDVLFDETRGQDFYVKLANGNLRAQDVFASMFEVENVNGDINVRHIQAQDAVLSTVNGDLSVTGSVDALRFQTVNGVARADLGAAVSELNGASVNGNVGVSLPRTAALSGHVQTQFGRVVLQAQGLPDPQSARTVVLNRPGEKAGTIKLTTGAGDILLFDN